MIRPKDLAEWLDNKVTLEFLELLNQHRQAAYDLVTDVMINAPSVSDVDLCKIAQFRGQVHALDAVLDLETFLQEVVEIKEVKNEDV